MDLADDEGDHLAGLGMGSLAAIGKGVRSYQRGADTGEDEDPTEPVRDCLRFGSLLMAKKKKKRN